MALPAKVSLRRSPAKPGPGQEQTSATVCFEASHRVRTEHRGEMRQIHHAEVLMGEMEGLAEPGLHECRQPADNGGEVLWLQT